MKQLDVSDIYRVQENWAEWIVKTGRAYIEKENYTDIARRMIDELYGYKEGVVLFKPTKAGEKQFRLTLEGALSYFVGGNPAFPEDHGFALQPWKSVRFENAGFILKEDFALAMGNYFFMDMDGKEIKVEYTIGYFRNETGSLMINLHHSSLPFSIQ